MTRFLLSIGAASISATTCSTPKPARTISSTSSLRLLPPPARKRAIPCTSAPTAKRRKPGTKRPSIPITMNGVRGCITARETMEKSSHTRVCKLNASHTETKDCTFVEKDGKSVCSVCGGTYDGAPETFTVTYDANGGYCGNATESITTKEDPASYGVNDVANLSYAGEYVPQHDDVDGSNVLFLGWSTEKVPGIISFSADPETVAAYLKTTVTMDGDKTVYAVWGTDANKNGTPDVFQAKVTYKVVNGWWTDNGTTVLPNKEIVAWFNLYQKVGNTWKIATPALSWVTRFPRAIPGSPVIQVLVGL